MIRAHPTPSGLYPSICRRRSFGLRTLDRNRRRRRRGFTRSFWPSGAGGVAQPEGACNMLSADQVNNPVSPYTNPQSTHALINRAPNFLVPYLGFTLKSLQEKKPPSNLCKFICFFLLYLGSGLALNKTRYILRFKTLQLKMILMLVSLLRFF